MKKIKQVITLLAMLASSSLCAQKLIIEDFDNYVDTESLHKAVFSFGSAAQAGRPSLAKELGVGDSDAACFALTWSTGNNANLSLKDLSQNARNLSGYSEIRASIFIENQSGSLAESVNSTRVKIAVEGGSDNSIWQTRTIKAERPTVNTFYELRFDLSTVDMERVEGTSSLESVIRDIESLRIRFENSQQPGLQQNAYIDSIVAVQ